MGSHDTGASSWLDQGIHSAESANLAAGSGSNQADCGSVPQSDWGCEGGHFAGRGDQDVPSHLHFPYFQAGWSSAHPVLRRPLVPVGPKS